MIQIKWNPTEKDLRIFAIGQVVFFGLLMAGFVRRGGSLQWVAIIMSMSSLVGLIGIIQPTWIKRLYLGWMFAVFPIGWCVSHLLLTAIFGLLIIPLGLLLRCLRIDPMGRRFNSRLGSYWTSRGPVPPASRYFRQF